ncbi:hypothetical protein [Flavivirga jejuensis]|uniref:Uncharacterized protein n=1 Tax=Flavivirga jejuensis TaxID=870487 RepID=A0ABT8WNC7_9FLAO|nr:hypothetical protein [Flavivirga jejuensis]MDO5974530.1 hypothetical protein [Flavivirga jejuensis]
MSLLDIHTIVNSFDAKQIPKKVKIFDAAFKEVKSFWLTGKDSQSIELESGMYVISLVLPSGKEMEQVVKVDSQSEYKIEFDLSTLSPHETHEWAHMSKQVAATSKVNLNDTKYLGSWIRLWHLSNEQWTTKKLNITDSSSWDQDGVSYTFHINEELQFLQVGGPNIPWRFIALPPARELKCLIKPNDGPTKFVHPLEITITTENWEAETILTLLGTNANEKAEELYEHSYLKEVSAEDLLYGKMTNPSAAAIGAYYLLRLEKFDRLHNWAKNLANWKEWMPDGSVIWAWQLIKKGRKTGNIDLEEIRSRLLQAVERGIPIYTEGLKLLLEGLKLLNYTNREDEAIKKALLKVSAYTESANWNSTVTMFNGEHPEKPNKKSRKGAPRHTDNLAFIYDVPAKAIIDMTDLTQNDMIEVITDANESVTFKAAKEGGFVSEKGGKYKSIYKAANQLKRSKKNLKKFNIKSSNIDLESEIRKFRKGDKYLG